MCARRQRLSLRPLTKRYSDVLMNDVSALSALKRDFKSSMLLLAQKCQIGAEWETARRQMGGKTGEWGEGPAGATVPYDVRGLHAARGANWTAPRGDIR